MLWFSPDIPGRPEALGHCSGSRPRPLHQIAAIHPLAPHARLMQHPYVHQFHCYISRSLMPRCFCGLYRVQYSYRMPPAFGCQGCWNEQAHLSPNNQRRLGRSGVKFQGFHSVVIHPGLTRVGPQIQVPWTAKQRPVSLHERTNTAIRMTPILHSTALISAPDGSLPGCSCKTCDKKRKMTSLKSQRRSAPVHWNRLQMVGQNEAWAYLAGDSRKFIGPARGRSRQLDAR